MPQYTEQSPELKLPRGLIFIEISPGKIRLHMISRLLFQVKISQGFIAVRQFAKSTLSFHLRLDSFLHAAIFKQ